MDNQIEKTLGHTFNDKNLLKLAFTHSSYSYEKSMDAIFNNERLEFLGDAVLELSISNYLYKTYDTMLEGDLTKLRASVVCEGTLAKNSKNLQLGEHLLFGKGEEQTGGRTRDSILADTFEAVIGAIYLDSGFEKAEKFVLDNLIDDINELKDSYLTVDYKTFLQEYYQGFSKEPLKYEIVNESGPAHDKIFTSRLLHNNTILGKGEGKSKKEAEQNAAYNALKKNTDFLDKV